jgi:tripartite-type tricarboxylate transporter receptor subunit TctC
MARRPDRGCNGLHQREQGMKFRLVVRIVLAVAVAQFLVALPTLARADYPDRTIQLVVPYPPGGTADILGRLISVELGNVLKQTVVVINRGGAAGNIAAQTVKIARPDGYTLMLGNAPVLAINPHLFSEPGFDAIKDFEPVAPIADTPLFLIANPAAPYHSVKEFVEYCRKNDGRATYAAGSVGSTTNLAMFLFMKQANFKATTVAYKGSGPALLALTANEVPVMFELLPSAMGFMKDGRVRPLAVTSARRQPTNPDVPTIAESGYPGFEVASWFGVVAPAGTPKAILDLLNKTLTQITASPQFRARLAELGATPMSETREEFAKLIRTDNVRWGIAVKESGAKIE